MITLLRNADVHAPEALGIRHLLLSGERILWLGTEPPDLPETLLSEDLDLEGRRLIPGLIDGHAHLTGGGGEAGYGSKVPPQPLSVFTRAGVTTVVGVLGTDDLSRSTAELLMAARGLDAEGLSAYCLTGGYHVPPTTLTGSARADIVYIDRILGIGELAISDHRSSQPTLDELLRLASEAHVAGLMSGKAGILHLHLGDGPRGLALVREALAQSEIPARVFNPTHVNRQPRLLDEAFELAARGCFIDLTAFPADDDDPAVPADEALIRYLERVDLPDRDQRRNHGNQDERNPSDLHSRPPADKRLPVGGVTVSSDGGGCLPVFDADGRIERMGVGLPDLLLETLGAVVSKGISLEHALPAFTSNVADHLRLKRKGRIAAGMDADLVVLDERGRAHEVWARGRRMVADGRVQVFGRFEERAGSEAPAPEASSTSASADAIRGMS